MADSGGTKTQTVTSQSNSAPWGPTQPGLQQGITDLGSLYKSGNFNVPYYPAQTVADASPLQTQSWNAISSQAGTPTSVNAADKYNSAILNGDYSSLQPMIDAVKDATNSNYEAAGRYGSGSNDKAVATGVGQVISNAAATAAGQSPMIQQGLYQPATYLDQAGQEQQAQSQNQINAAINKFNYQQTEPISAINNYMQALSGNWGGTTVGTQTQPVYMPSYFNQGGGAASALGGLGLSAYGLGLFG